MKIDIFKGYGNKEIIETDVNPQELDLKLEDLSFDGKVLVICRIFKDVDLVRLLVKTHATLMMQCSRCIGNFKQNIVGEFSIVVRRLREGESISDYIENGEDDNEDSLIYIEHDIKSIDITQFARDAIMLSIPLKPICSENCKGLCAECGQNLNVGKCKCGKKRIDPRWKDLKGLFGNSPKSLQKKRTMK